MCFSRRALPALFLSVLFSLYCLFVSQNQIAQALKPVERKETNPKNNNVAAKHRKKDSKLAAQKEADLGMALVEAIKNTTNQSYGIRMPEVNASGIPIVSASLPDRNNSEITKPTPTQSNKLAPKHPTDIVPLEMQQSSPHRVPHQLVFTGKYNILEAKQPKVVHDNLLNTIAAYRSFWNEPDAPVWFLDNADCERVMGYTNQTLLGYFRNERSGPFKSDICRAVALYLVGGYYFDNDVAVMTRPYAPPSNLTSFVTVHMEQENFVMQGIMIAERESPVLRATFDTMGVYYSNKPYQDRERKKLMGRKMKMWMGPWTVKQAIELVRQNLSTAENEIVLLREIHLDNGSDPNGTLPRQTFQKWGGLCNYAIGQPNTNSSDPRVFDAYFWTRAVGISRMCT